MDDELSRIDFTFQYPPFNVLNRREIGWNECGDPHVPQRPMHLYLHIPYCRSKCQFCFYKVWGVGTGEKAFDSTHAYLETLFREIDLYAQSSKVQSRAVRSIYIGGGTPSLLSVRQIEALTSKLRQSFQILPNCEFSFEAYPDEDVLTSEKLHCLREAGINRLSIGVQSLDDRIQELNGRPARKEQLLRIYSRARSLGFPSINLDFMSGMVGETWQTWKSQIDSIMDLAPENVSLYKLEFYLNSGLTTAIRRGNRKANLVMSDAEEAKFAAYAFDCLQDKGAYIASNSSSLTKSRPVEQVHTKSVWNGEDLLAVGLSAYGIFEGYMYQNTSSLDAYVDLVSKKQLPVLRAHHITKRESIARTMVNGVKVLELSRQEFVARHGFDMADIYSEKVKNLVERDFVEFNDSTLRVQPKFYVHADDICRTFFLPEHATMMTSQLRRNKIIERNPVQSAEHAVQQNG